jgi:hypothetical protein
VEKQYSTPKVTIDLDEYNRLKDIEFQAFGILKGKIEVKNTFVRSPNFLLDPLAKYGSGKGVIIGRIKKEDFDFYFKNLFNIDELIINKGEGEK